MTSLSKRDIAVELAAKFNLNQAMLVAMVDQVFLTIIDSLAEGRDVELRDYAVFRIVEQKSRMGRNPNVPDTDIPIPAHFRVKLKPGRLMREAMARLTAKRDSEENSAPG